MDMVDDLYPNIYHLLFSVAGNWAQWTVYGTCSKTCDGGVQSRTRSCSDPAAAFGGLECALKSNPSIRAKNEIESRVCSTQPCLGERYIQHIFVTSSLPRHELLVK